MTGECPPEDELVRMVEGALGDASLAAIESHVDRCERCAAVIAGLGAIDSAAAKPRMVGRYQLDRRIGGGGMGEVWAAWDPQLRRDIAVKLVKPERADDDRERERLLREARALARLAHPNVLAVYDVGELATGEVFIATELVAGDTLASRGGAAADWRGLARLYAQAARGLHAAHGAGLVHRDVKPANLLIGGDGRVRVADFGLAVKSATPSPIAPTELASDRSADRITQTGYIAGTPAYMAPEQRLGEPADARADQYALCVALAESIAGRRPPLDIDADALIAFVGERRAREPDLDRLCGVLARGLAIDRNDRFPDAGALAEAIDACAAPPVSASTAPPAPARRSSRRALAIAGVAAVAGVASVLVVARALERDEPAPRPAVAAAAPDAAPAPDASAVAVAVPVVDAAAPSVAPAPPPAPVPVTAKPPAAITFEQQEQIQLGIAAATRALNKRDGRGCLAQLDKLPARVPVMTGHLIAFHRGQCEMLLGDCERGKQRVNAALDAMGSNPIGDDLAIALCPIAGGPLARRLKQLVLQAHTQTTAAGCRRYIDHARAIGREAGAADKGMVAGVLRHIAECVGKAGDCGAAATLWKEAHALDRQLLDLRLAGCPPVTIEPPQNPAVTLSQQLAKVQQAIARRDLAPCRALLANPPADVPQGFEQTALLVQGTCEMVTGNCKAGTDLVAKAYGGAHPRTVASNVDTYCPIAGTLEQRLHRIEAQLSAFADKRFAQPVLAWCNHLVGPARTAAREAQGGPHRARAAAVLHHLAWCVSTAGRCGDAADLASLAVATDPDVSPRPPLSAKCP